MDMSKHQVYSFFLGIIYIRCYFQNAFEDLAFNLPETQGDGPPADHSLSLWCRWSDGGVSSKYFDPCWYSEDIKMHKDTHICNGVSDMYVCVLILIFFYNYFCISLQVPIWPCSKSSQNLFVCLLVCLSHFHFDLSTLICVWNYAQMLMRTCFFFGLLVGVCNIKKYWAFWGYMAVRLRLSSGIRLKTFATSRNMNFLNEKKIRFDQVFRHASKWTKKWTSVSSWNKDFFSNEDDPGHGRNLR